MSIVIPTSPFKPTAAIAHAQLRAFTVTSRTAHHATIGVALHRSSIDAYMAAADAHGDTPCGITVTPAAAQ